MAIYEGVDKKGKKRRTFEIVSNLEAARYFKASTDRNDRPDLVPLTDVNGYPLKCILKTGTMVLFYENTPAELYECSRKELVKRLYKVTAMAAEGRVQFLFIRMPGIRKRFPPYTELEPHNSVYPNRRRNCVSVFPALTC